MGHDMEVRRITRLGWLFSLCACLELGSTSRALPAPAYTIVDLGEGSLANGTGSGGTGTVTGSTGLAYTFIPSQNDLPAKWTGTTAGVPIVALAPVWDPRTYGNPNYAYSHSTLVSMNAQGLGAGINSYGVDGHQATADVFLTQLQPDGTWGSATSLWSGLRTFSGREAYQAGIFGVSSSGQVLGFGAASPVVNSPNVLFLYDSKTGSLTNLSELVNSSAWTTPPGLPLVKLPTWYPSAASGQLDDQGRILIQATQGGYDGPEHNLLLVPQGLSADPLSVPEPAAWSVFATLLGGWLVVGRRQGRVRQAVGRPS
jgi:hypothetical protein